MAANSTCHSLLRAETTGKASPCPLRKLDITYLDRAIIIEPSKESCGVPVRVRTLPLPIRPDQVGLVAGRHRIGTACYLNLLSSPVLWTDFCNKHLKLRAGRVALW